jgi:membrane protease YdiL (CAAX protease family)
MNEEIIIQKDTKKDFYAVSLKVGAVVFVFFAMRICLMFAISGLSKIITDKILSETLSLAVNALFLYAVPIVFAVKLLGIPKGLYKKTRNFSKTLACFPAMYGLGQIVNLATWLIIWVVTMITGSNGGVSVNDMMNLQKTATPLTAVILSVYTVILAPLCEEFLTRGLIMRRLKPYGAGFSIIVSSLVFGMMHVNLRQMPYAFVLGLALGYISYATDSIRTTTILHAIFNGTSMIFLFLQSVYNNTPRTNGEDIVNSIYKGYIVIIFSLVVIGMFAFFNKIKDIRKYKFNGTYDITAAEKSEIMLKTPAVAAGLVMFAVNVIITK